MTLNAWLYRKAYGKYVPHRGDPEEIPLTTRELVLHLLRKGGPARLRGLLWRWRVKKCGRRLYVGRRVRIEFPRFLTMGSDCFIADGVYLNALSLEGYRLGDHVRLREGLWTQATSALGDPGVGLWIGDNTYIGPMCILGAGGGLEIGSDVTIGANVDILAENHVFSDATKKINEQPVSRKGIRVGDDCWIGNRAIILDGVSVGKGSVIGAGAVVTEDLPEYSVAAGVPARVIRKRGEKESDEA